MANEISIKVNVGDRMYPLQISAFEEEYVRKAVKLLNEKMTFFNNSFSGKDKVDGLAMAALEYAVDGLKKDTVMQKPQAPKQDLSLLENELSEIEALLQS
ncbi:MAG: cell division protein ZapA [bacterium]|nr:cell division protein ZapA [bacterium]